MGFKLEELKKTCHVHIPPCLDVVSYYYHLFYMSLSVRSRNKIVTKYMQYWISMDADQLIIRSDKRLVLATSFLRRRKITLKS